MTLYRVGGSVHGSCYVGEFHANDAWDAIEQARNHAGVSLCHECAREISDPEVTCLWAEDDTGDCTSEPSDHDEVVRLSKEVGRLQDALNSALSCEADAVRRAEDVEQAIHNEARTEALRIAEWLRTTPRANGVLISIMSSQDIARLATGIENGEHVR